MQGAEETIMSVSSIHSALAGVILNQDRFAAAADRVSRWRATNPAGAEAPADLVREVVKMKQALAGVEASITALRTTDRLTGLLLDVYA
jgi:hypothetical protein